jgi:hypothetical protein
MEIAKKFKLAINRTFSASGGVFWQPVSDEQLTRYVMGLLENFVSNNWKVYKGTLTIGRQLNLRRVNKFGEFEDGEVDEDLAYSTDVKDDFDSSVHILNEKLQVSNYKVMVKIRAYGSKTLQQ